MLLVRMTNDGNNVYAKYGKLQYASEPDHEQLLHFLDLDCSQVSILLQVYFQSVVDPRTLNLVANKKPMVSALNKVKKLLKEAHPFFLANDDYADIPAMLANHLNLLLIKNLPIEEAVSLAWYGERLKPLVHQLLLDSSNILKSGSLTPVNMELDYNRFEQVYYKKYIEEQSLGRWQKFISSGLKMVEIIQKRINLQMYWMIDASAKRFNHLTFEQRARLYHNIVAFDNDIADLKVVRRISFSDPKHDMKNPVARSIDAYNRVFQAVDDNEINDLIKELEQEDVDRANKRDLRQIFVNVNDNDFNLDSELTAILNKEIEKAKAEQAPALFEEYEIENLYQLLLLELEQMIRNRDIVKRCRNCHRYYISGNMNIEYCSRIAPNEEVPCSEIGSKRAFGKKLEDDYPLKIYNRAYKTHYARKMKGNMSGSDFETWRNDAKARLELVRAGKAECEKFEQWLKV